MTARPARRNRGTSDHGVRPDAAQPPQPGRPRPPHPGGVAVSRVLPVPAEEAWALLGDVRNHARWVPFTRVDVDTPLPAGAAPTREDAATSTSKSAATPTPEGARFTAVTAPTRRAPGLVDRMVVVDLDPPRSADDGPGTPGVARYRKLGPVLLGTASLHVRPLGPTTCQVTWGEDVHLRGFSRRLTAPLLRPFARATVALTLRRAAAEITRPHP